MLIFDCDGVLVDSEPLAARVNAEVLTELGFPYTAEAVASRFTGVSLKDMVERIEAEHGRALPHDIADRITAATLASFEMALQPIAGVREAILGLPHRRCVASSSLPERIALSLKVTGLSDLFDHVFSSAEVKRGKPAPDLFLHAAARMGAAPAECLVVEDSIFGVQAACAAGMPVIGFTGGGHCGPDHAQRLGEAGATTVIDRMADLPAAVWAHLRNGQSRG